MPAVMHHIGWHPLSVGTRKALATVAWAGGPSQRHPVVFGRHPTARSLVLQGLHDGVGIRAQVAGQPYLHSLQLYPCMMLPVSDVPIFPVPTSRITRLLAVWTAASKLAGFCNWVH